MSGRVVHVQADYEMPESEGLAKGIRYGINVFVEVPNISSNPSVVAPDRDAAIALALRMAASDLLPPP